MARHHALNARDELEHRPRRDRPDLLPGGHDPFEVNEEPALEALRMRFGDVCDITARDGTLYAERRGHEVSGDTPDALCQAILIAWGAR